jgi:predicted metal-dependent peptidase
MVTTRPLNHDETEALAAARLVALQHAPYLATALFAMRPVAAEGLGTFGVDGAWRLYLDPATLSEWGAEHAGGVLLHEAGHLVRDHSGRVRALGSRVDRERWGLATDAAINDDLIEAGIPLPGSPVTPGALGLPDGGIEEAYYHALTPPEGEEEDQAIPEPEDGYGCGSGAGDKPAPWELGLDDDAAPGLDSGQVEIVLHRVAHDVVNHIEAKGRGSVPAGFERWASRALTAPALPWTKVLAGMVRHIAALTTGRVTYSYSRPGRRRIPGIVMPAMRAPRPRVSVVVDTSGSMSEGDLAAALAEVQGVLKAVGGTVRVLTCDAATGDVQTIRNADSIRLTGGGGTDMRVGIAAAEADRERPDAVVVMTDGYTPWPQRPTRARLVVVVIGNTTQADVPAWARVLSVPASD